MTFRIFSFFALLLALNSSAQPVYDLDDTRKYDLLYPEDLCKLLAKSKNIALLDVRSPGEFHDTSSWKQANRGRLKGAMNINIDDVDSLIGTIKALKNDTIITYCSHSQRSRRVAARLEDAGFTHVINLNGGMTWINANKHLYPCLNELLEYHVPYRLLSPKEFADGSRQKNALLLDVRPDSEYNGKDTIDALNVGRWKNAKHVRADSIVSFFRQNPALKDRAIYLYDYDGSLSGNVAMKLDSLGVRSVHVAMNGLFELFYSDDYESLRNDFEYALPYKLINARKALQLLEQKNVLVLDGRPRIEYESQAKEHWKNIGKLRGAICLENTDLDSLLKMHPRKNAPVLVYNAPRKSTLLRTLCEKGYTNVYCLHGGLWSVYARQANEKDFGAEKFLVREKK